MMILDNVIKRVKPKFYVIGLLKKGIRLDLNLIRLISLNSFKKSLNTYNVYFEKFIKIDSKNLNDAIIKSNNREDIIFIEYFDKLLNSKEYGLKLFSFVYTYNLNSLKRGLHILKLNYPFVPKIDRIDLNKTNFTAIIHTASTRNTIPDIAYVQIDKQSWSAIGYHFVILENGIIINTRPLNLKGSHCWGINDSIGICFARNLNKACLTNDEIHSFNDLIHLLKAYYPIKSIIGHIIGQLSLIRNSLIYDSELNRDKIFIYKKEIESIKLLDDLISGCLMGRNTDSSKLKKELFSILRDNEAILDKEFFFGNTKKSLKYLIESLKDCPGKYFSFELYDYEFSVEELKVA
jgi:hypothetical protein